MLEKILFEFYLENIIVIKLYWLEIVWFIEGMLINKFMKIMCVFL